MFPMIPCPYASPKCRNVAGDTTSTLDAALPDLLDRIRHKAPRGVFRPAGIRRRQYENSQPALVEPTYSVCLPNRSHAGGNRR